jgi:phage tail-like protein
MALLRERPYLNCHFQVDLGRGEAAGPLGGFAQVELPPLRVPVAPGTEAPQPPPVLVLRRGVQGQLDLVDWWKKAAQGRAPQRRTVTVELLNEDHSAVVMTWRFRGARPVSLRHGMLDALQPAVLMETVEIAFDSVEVA